MDEHTVKVGVGTLIFDLRGQLLLGRRKSSHGNGTWCPPGGHLEFGESFEQAAIREAQEETGLVLQPQSLQIVGITNDFFAESERHYVTVMMRAGGFEGTPQLKEPDKFEEWQWFDLSVLPENLFLPVQNFFKKHSPETLI